MSELKVLFVEDEPDVRFIVELAMSLDPLMHFRTFESGLAALEAIDAQKDHFDLALVNLRLPFMTGIELHERLKLVPGLQDITTILITASLREMDIAAARRAGIKGHISKPFDAPSLTTQIRQIYEQ